MANLPMVFEAYMAAFISMDPCPNITEIGFLCLVTGLSPLDGVIFLWAHVSLRSSWPRNYPIRFGLKLVQLRKSLVRDRFVRVKPTGEPTGWDHLTAMLSNLDWSHIWHDAELGSVCQYLWGSTNLQLPDDIRKLVPKAI